MQALRHAIERAKGQSQLARRIQRRPQEIWNWLHRQGTEIPAKACIAIEREFPDITRAKLRPNDWREIWPEMPGLALTPHCPDSIEWRGLLGPSREKITKPSFCIESILNAMGKMSAKGAHFSLAGYAQ